MAKVNLMVLLLCTQIGAQRLLHAESPRATPPVKTNDEEILQDLELLENMELLEELDSAASAEEPPPAREDQDAPPPKRRGRLPYGQFPGT